MEKPSIEEVLKYAKPLIANFIKKFAADLPYEQKEEIHQEANLRLLEAYPDLNPEAGWKSFVYNHSRGAVLDFMKFGKGFAEDKWSIQKPEENGSRHVNKIRDRVKPAEDQVEFDIDAVLGAHGVFSEMDMDSPNINWELVSRMSSTDQALRAFSCWLRGFSIEELGPIMGLSRARVGQLIEEFVARFDDPTYALSPWFCQILWALGLARRFNVPDKDQSELVGYSLGWHLTPINLDSTDHKPVYRELQEDFFKTFAG